MFCTNCGKQLADTAKFCTDCGTPVKAPAPAQPEEPINPYAQPVSAPAAPDPQPVPYAIPVTPPAQASIPEEPVNPYAQPVSAPAAPDPQPVPYAIPVSPPAQASIPEEPVNPYAQPVPDTAPSTPVQEPISPYIQPAYEQPQPTYQEPIYYADNPAVMPSPEQQAAQNSEANKLLVFGILSVALPLTYILGIGGLVLGILGLYQAKKQRAVYGVLRGKANAGFILSIIGTILSGLLVFTLVAALLSCAPLCMALL